MCVAFTMADDAFIDLTARERECLRLTARPMSSKEIAAELSISPGTVDKYIESAKIKLGIRRRGAAAAALVEHERRAKTPTPKLEGQSEPIAELPILELLTPPDRSNPAPTFTVPVLRFRRTHNDLSPMQRLAWIFALAFGMLVGVGTFLNSLGTLYRLGNG